MQYLAFILNLPWTIVGILAGLLSIPTKITINKDPFAIIFKVKSFWWYNWLPGRSRVRGSANGHAIRLGPLEQPNDLEHELIHVEQAIRSPLIHPLLYTLESFKNGYRQNKYEVEAYGRSGSKYKRK